MKENPLPKIHRAEHLLQSAIERGAQIIAEISYNRPRLNQMMVKCVNREGTVQVWVSSGFINRNQLMDHLDKLQLFEDIPGAESRILESRIPHEFLAACVTSLRDELNDQLRTCAELVEETTKFLETLKS